MGRNQKINFFKSLSYSGLFSKASILKMMRLVNCNGVSLLLLPLIPEMSKAKETKKGFSPTREGGRDMEERDAYCTERLTALMAHVVMPEALILTVLSLFL